MLAEERIFPRGRSKISRGVEKRKMCRVLQRVARAAGGVSLSAGRGGTRSAAKKTDADKAELKKLGLCFRCGNKLHEEADSGAVSCLSCRSKGR